jgi:hypothetical protein
VEIDPSAAGDTVNIDLGSHRSHPSYQLNSSLRAVC